MTPPPCRMLFRSKDGVELYKVPSSSQDVIEKGSDRPWLLKGATTLQVVSPDGSRVYLHQPGMGVVMLNLNGESLEKAAATPFFKDSTGVQFLSVSPKGTFVLTWERPSKSDAQAPNLKVWDGITGDFLYGFVQKSIKNQSWPYLQWTPDERYAFFLATNEIRVYDGSAFCNKEEEVRYIDKMRSQGIVSMSVPRQAAPTSPKYLVTSFVPTQKDKPARMSLLKYPNTPQQAGAYPALVSRSLYQVEEVGVHWSPKGDTALVSMQTSVDTSGESYYGSATLYLFPSDGSDASAVTLPKNSSTGPVLDVAWMPNPSKPSCFCVISGRMPTMSSLHHGTSGEPLFLFGNAHRNTVSWAPQGRFVCLAGFGNLAGGMSFWDRNKQKPIPQYDASGKPVLPEVKANCTVGYGWSPDSRNFYSSTTSPRMNVDNGVKLFRYNGQQLLNVPWDNENYKPDKLLEAVFVPALPDTYPDRPQSPPPRGGDTDVDMPAPVAAAPPPKPAGRYVPPSARGKMGGGTSLAERMRREKEGNMMGATKVTKSNIAAVSSSAKKTIPGMTPVADNSGGGKSKSAQRKERQRAAKAKREAEEAQQKVEVEAAAAAAAADPEKRARKIKKTLKQIEELKTKDASSLNEDQQKKLASEAQLREELAKLEL